MNNDHAHLMRLMFSCYQAQVVGVFAVMDVAEHLAAGPLTVSELADAAGCHEPSLLRLLRAAAHLELVGDNGDNRFALTSAGRLLCAGEPEGLKNFARMLCSGDGMWLVAGAMDHTVRTGEPAFDQVFGKAGYDWLAERPNAERVFYQAIIELATIETPPVVAACELSDVDTLVDVGGGTGLVTAQLLAACPGLSATIVDTAMGLGQTHLALAKAGVDDRCSLVTADFFSDPLPRGADAYLIKSVLNDWDDDHVVQILSNCQKAMRPDSRLLVVEPIMPTDTAALVGWSTVLVMSDLCAMVGNGGQIRTEPQWRALLAAAGLTLTRIIDQQADHGFSILWSKPS